jgi:phage terminase large subunit
MQRNGFPRMVKALNGKDSVHDGIEFLKSYDIVVHPRCENTIRDLRLYSYETDKLTGEILPKLADDNNHVIDALRYALEAHRRALRASVGELRI